MITVPVAGDVADQAAFDVGQARSATPCMRCPAPTRRSGGTSAIYLDIQEASHRDNRVIIPVVLLVVMLILMLLLRARPVAGDPDA